jgi:short-subunit dehydrogenase
MVRRLALITGASAGMGAAFAREYARQGYDLALVARRRDRLESLAAELRSAHGIETLVIPVDLAEPTANQAIVDEIAAHGRHVDALVNNAGFGVAGRYTLAPWEKHSDSLQVMLNSVCELTYRVLPGMLERRFGRILNVASLAAMAPGVGGHTLYAATKSFLVKFSQSLHVECKMAGVHVTALCPGFTWTEFHDVDGSREVADTLPKFLWTEADFVAARGFKAVEQNRPVVVPGFHNHVMKAVVGAIPETWILNMSAKSAAKPDKKPKGAAPAPAPQAAAAIPAAETVLAVPAARPVEEKRAAA